MALTPARLLLVVITDSGRVDQRIVELGDTIGEPELAQLRELLGQALIGRNSRRPRWRQPTWRRNSRVRGTSAMQWGARRRCWWNRW